MKKLLLFLLALPCLISAQVVGRQSVDSFPLYSWSNQVTYGLTWLPVSYSISPAKKYPLIIFLHGAGQNGTGITGLSNLITDGLSQNIANGWNPVAVNPKDRQTYEFIVISPQDANPWSYSYDQVKIILPAILKRYRVDSSRIYITGLSAGGDGSLTCVTADTAFTKLFAACAVASTADMDGSSILGLSPSALESNLKSTISKYGVGVWLTYGDQDGLHSSLRYEDSLNAFSPVPASKLTVLAGVGHSAWKQLYNTAFRPIGNYYGHAGEKFASQPSTNSSSVAGSGITQDSLNVFEWLLTFQRSLGAAAVTPVVIPPVVIPPVGHKKILLGTGDPRYPQTWYTNVATQVNAQPGDTLVIPTGTKSCLLSNFHGTSKDTIVIIPADSGKIGGYTDYAFSITNANFFKAYGFHIDGKDSSNGLFAVKEGATNYALHDLWLHNGASEGLQCKWDQDTANPATYYPSAINDVLIYNVQVQNVADEAVYLGNMNDVTKPLAAPFVNLTLHHISTDSTGRMGIILSDIIGLHAHDLSVNRFGLMKLDGYINGVAIGQDVTLADSMYNVRINNGTGAGLLDFGRGVQKLRNWTITNTATLAGQDAIYVKDAPDLGYNLPPLQLDLSGFTITGAAHYALNATNENGTQLPGTIANFNYTGTALGIFDQVDKINVPAPAAPKTIKSILITYSDGTTEVKP